MKFWGRPASSMVVVVIAPQRTPVNARALSTISCRTVFRSRLALTRSTAALSRERRSGSTSFSCRGSSGFFKTSTSLPDGVVASPDWRSRGSPPAERDRTSASGARVLQ